MSEIAALVEESCGIAKGEFVAIAEVFPISIEIVSARSFGAVSTIPMIYFYRSFNNDKSRSIDPFRYLYEVENH